MAACTPGTMCLVSWPRAGQQHAIAGTRGVELPAVRLDAKSPGPASRARGAARDDVHRSAARAFLPALVWLAAARAQKAPARPHCSDCTNANAKFASTELTVDNAEALPMFSVKQPCFRKNSTNLAKPMAAFALLRLPANLSNPRQIRPRAAALLPGTRMHGGACGPGPVWRVPGRVHATDWPCEKHRSAYSVGLMRSGTPATHAQFLFGKFRQATVVAQGLHGVRACSGQEFTPPSSAGGAASLKKEADKAC
ncbi:hypothetical protein AK812_SmicGene36436 [Symbiodinium microadriaticum]|uniref:Uncharacterized protein n=1 Tax=Symbiodinium microadriaticum TaxID=2951 RepID=A0A1Q9CIX6_SYMMI|nr:hypothetical protein AK812_SmicGene36436 [Symbiodinium microadriaticum]